MGVGSSMMRQAGRTDERSAPSAGVGGQRTSPGPRPDPGGAQRPARAHRPEAGANRIMLTGRGAVFLMIGVFGAGLLANALTGWAVLPGLAFLAGSVAAARYTKPADLLTAAVTPPLVFMCLLLPGKALSAAGNALLAVAAGSALSLASIAPWLFAGTAVNLIVGWRRGLLRCVADLRRDLRSPAPRPR